MPPLGLGYLAAMLKTAGFSIWIHDNTLLAYSDEMIARLIKQKNPSIVGMYAATPMINRAKDISKIAYTVNPDILVVLGGPHPSCAIEETLEFCDIVVVGEAENTIVENYEKVFKSQQGF